MYVVLVCFLSVELAIMQKNLSSYQMAVAYEEELLPTLSSGIRNSGREASFSEATTYNNNSFVGGYSFARTTKRLFKYKCELTFVQTLKLAVTTK